MSEYKSEKAFTRNQLRKLVYEEVYMNNDMTINNYNPNTGYQLNYPQFFSSNPSQDKSIAPRRIQVSPSSHQFRLCISYKDAALQVHSTNAYFLVDVLQDNTTQEILNFIRESSVCQDGGSTLLTHSLPLLSKASPYLSGRRVMLPRLQSSTIMGERLFPSRLVSIFVVFSRCESIFHKKYTKHTKNTFLGAIFGGTNPVHGQNVGQYGFLLSSPHKNA